MVGRQAGLLVTPPIDGSAEPMHAHAPGVGVGEKVQLCSPPLRGTKERSDRTSDVCKSSYKTIKGAHFLCAGVQVSLCQTAPTWCRQLESCCHCAFWRKSSMRCYIYDNSPVTKS